jgi:hypothetical protein
VQQLFRPVEFLPRFNGAVVAGQLTIRNQSHGLSSSVSGENKYLPSPEKLQ